MYRVRSISILQCMIVLLCVYILFPVDAWSVGRAYWVNETSSKFISHSLLYRSSVIIKCNLYSRRLRENGL